MSVEAMDEAANQMEEVKRKIHQEIYTLKKNPSTRSIVWKVLSVIVDEENKEIDFVSCDECSKILKRNKRTTSNLVQHPCIKKLKCSVTQISNEDKKLITSSCVQWTIRNCVPFSVIHGEGFKKITNEVLKIGSKYGQNIDVDHMLPHRTTLSRNISKVYDFFLPKIKEELNAVQFGAITTDLWTDQYRRLSYISLTVQYMKNFEIVDRILAVSHFDYNRQTAANIENKIQHTLEDLTINPDKFVFVTDRGSNIIAALANQTRFSCSAHILNNVLNAASQKSSEFSEFCAKCKALVKFFKKSSNLQKDLTTTLKSEGETRWNSKLYMFQSIKNNFNLIASVLNEKHLLEKIDGVSVEKLNEIIQYLQIYETASTELQSSLKPTLHLCYPHYYHLKQQSEPKPTDSHLIEVFKAHCKEILAVKWRPEIKIDHLAATFLHPPCKMLLFFSDAEKLNIYDFINQFYQKIKLPTNDQSQVAVLEEAPPNRISNGVVNIFLPFGANEIIEDGQSSVRNEIRRYLDEPRLVVCDVTEYWKERVSSFPILNQVFCALSSIPASSAASERAFSKANILISEKRSQLKSDNVNKMLVLNSHFKQNDEIDIFNLIEDD